MSLIQEALRRQQEESQNLPPETLSTQNNEPQPSPPPPPEPPLPEPPLQEEPPLVAPPSPMPANEEVPPLASAKPRRSPKSKSTWTTLIGILFVIVLLLGGAIWILHFAVQQWKHSSADDVPTPPVLAVVPEAPAVEPTPPAEPSKPAEQADETVAPTSSPSTAALEAPSVHAAPLPNAAPVAVSQTPSAETVPTPAEAPVATQTEAVQPEPVRAVEWPTLSLQGVLGKGKNGSAIVNNQVLAVNESIEGARIVAVGPQSALVEYQGERRIIKVGMSTR